MSSDRVTYGLMAELQFEVPKDKRDEVYDELEEQNLFINYEGTLIYHKQFDGEPWETGFLYGTKSFGDMQKFIDLCDEHGMIVKEETVEPFHAIWYDGCDAPMNIITVKEFRED
ncbi:hypothetical protein SEPL_233 [Salmonella phage SE_PL]|nr:hypothetical protein CPT_Munch_192 [Salmonella phage Munch]QCW18878.1 hypothetical protein 7t3_0357 [Salmonella phage 7t3]QIG62846.1 hypothetical protein SEPL_233 [Salmonella phage SE_PL]WNV47300.1 hypothetical protein [Klebsiella phage fENko-Kae01]